MKEIQDTYEEKYVRIIIKIYINLKIYNQLYEEWRGSNYFYCYGRCVLGPQTFRPLLLTSLIGIIPTILFLYFEFEVSFLL